MKKGRPGRGTPGIHRCESLVRRSPAVPSMTIRLRDDVAHVAETGNPAVGGADDESGLTGHVPAVAIAVESQRVLLERTQPTELEEVRIDDHEAVALRGRSGGELVARLEEDKDALLRLVNLDGVDLPAVARSDVARDAGRESVDRALDRHVRVHFARVYVEAVQRCDDVVEANLRQRRPAGRGSRDGVEQASKLRCNRSRTGSRGTAVERQLDVRLHDLGVLDSLVAEHGRHTSVTDGLLALGDPVVLLEILHDAGPTGGSLERNVRGSGAFYEGVLLGGPEVILQVFDEARIDLDLAKVVVQRRVVGRDVLDEVEKIFADGPGAFLYASAEFINLMLAACHHAERTMSSLTRGVYGLYTLAAEGAAVRSALT